MNEKDFLAILEEFGYVVDPSFRVYTEEDGYVTYECNYDNGEDDEKVNADVCKYNSNHICCKISNMTHECEGCIYKGD